MERYEGEEVLASDRGHPLGGGYQFHIFAYFLPLVRFGGRQKEWTCQLVLAEAWTSAARNNSGSLPSRKIASS